MEGPTALQWTLIVAFPLGFAAILFSLILCSRRIFEWMHQRGWIHYNDDTPTYGSAGNAMMNVHAILEPKMRHVLQAQDELAEESDDGAPPDPAAPSPATRPGRQ